MSAATALLDEMARLGISVRVQKGDLRLRPKKRVTPELVARLRRHKAELVRCVRLEQLDDDQLHAWVERVAICTVDGGLSDAAAESIAWAQIDAGKSENPPSLGRQKIVGDQ